MRRFTLTVFLSSVAAAASAQSAGMVIAIDGPAPQAIARFDDGRWVQVTDMLQCAPPGDVERVAATGGASAEPARTITRASDEWAALEGPIARLFEQRQREHTLVAANLTRVPIQIEWVYATPQRDGVSVYYFEASRRVPDPGTASEDDPKGTLRVVVSGWLQRAGTSIVVLGSKSELGWEQDQPAADVNRTRRPDLAPLGIVPHGSDSIWVMKGGVGDIGWVNAYLVGEFGVQAFVNGARCAR